MPDPALTITQGTDRVIVVKRIRDANGNVFDPTGWALRGVARVRVQGSAPVAEWSHNPTEGQGRAMVVDPTPGPGETVEPGEKWIELYVTPAMSRAWTWETAHLHVHMTEPVEPHREERIADRQLVNDHTTVRDDP